SSSVGVPLGLIRLLYSRPPKMAPFLTWDSVRIETVAPEGIYLRKIGSVPDEAREKAVEKAEAGEEITFATAREIVAEARKKKRPRRQKIIPAEKLAGRLTTVLERYRDRWDPKELAELARHLREFADSLDSQNG